MKRAELIIGKTYYVNKTNDWRSNHYSITKSYATTAERLKRYKVTIVETQLKTEYDKQCRTREVYARNSEGREMWIALSHIRCEWIEAVKILTDDLRQRIGYDDRANKYARHLARKVEREQYKPALKLFEDTIEELSGKYLSTYDRIEGGLSLEQLKIINEALSLLKTQKPQLTAVAS
jgi:hypothetical protein